MQAPKTFQRELRYEITYEICRFSRAESRNSKAILLKRPAGIVSLYYLLNIVKCHNISNFQNRPRLPIATFHTGSRQFHIRILLARAYVLAFV